MEQLNCEHYHNILCKVTYYSCVNTLYNEKKKKKKVALELEHGMHLLMYHIKITI